MTLHSVANLHQKPNKGVKHSAFMKRVGLITITALSLSACQSDNGNETVGTLLGAGLGAWLGNEIDGGRNRVAGTMIGFMAGAMIGNSIGKKLDKADRALAADAQYRSLEKSRSGQRTEWYNPDSGHRGYYVPERAVLDENTDRYCREYTHTVMIGGKEEKAYGKACRQPDGTWQIVNEDDY